MYPGCRERIARDIRGHLMDRPGNATIERRQPGRFIVSPIETGAVLRVGWVHGAVFDVFDEIAGMNSGS